ncbi:hypothetical protein E5720_16450 [Rhodococcus sp. PAMC28707]|uniref:transposase n=1 Tax=unclassified Rhodococcus (in: high G+C Gram-positive bacteria) TaxID=192944 RepID=UPI00109DA467|nr:MULTISPECIES: transposase [unclassified Rhodococcus (in: high G+C Gram-positive bacteria)]QCB51984.1 hypothetical protein E5769_19070 [Rhodococcus sp. PAMC28705]QCB59847.1 hypothetical protein E5720_16450 [Rhodococcus sp. PAMC28707]
MDTKIARPRVLLEVCPHVPQTQVVHDRVQGRGRPPGGKDSGRTIAEVAREQVINEALHGRWVANERRRMDAATATGDEPLTAAERTELSRLRKQVAE